ncbi:MAG: FADH(2)-oxidizing methylenetetrahydrofolate--tRNA-(uracil(54)-C(5))-methyltransferase TrmFO [Clostridia bacterium]|nr:FADH(2)-oxidizing methylenetetrahydrofolate--tRNA-(uracil(54)-C(5))-methyltransferase TrmFO [Clostridia bacterium]
MIKGKEGDYLIDRVTVVGGGLAGSEASWFLAERGIKVVLYEMRPMVNTPAHHTGYLGELVCSNSLRALSLENAAGLLKEEMKILGSLIIQCALENSVPAGGALGVDREAFAKSITEKIENHPNIEVIREEVKAIPEGVVIIASGPLTSPALSDAIKDLTGEEHLYFYDAASPIVTAESIDFSKTFKASRYGKGEPDYLNCPMNEEEYYDFYRNLIEAERHPLHDFEKGIFFEGCMPIEVLAQRGEKTLLFGPLKPVGIIDPRTGKQPFAVVQLRQENREATLYNIVGFQTNLKWPEQRRVFSKIPALKNAEFIRYGVMHRNTFINSPKLLKPTLQFKEDKKLFFAGQITGVEGYIESAASGIVAGINAERLIKDKKPVSFPHETAIGALCKYITSPNPNFQPMNINFGIIPPLEKRIKNKKKRNLALSKRALETLKTFVKEIGL